MKVLVIGSGGREHAIVLSLLKNPHISEIVCAPGNGGTALSPRCQNVEIATTDIPRLVEYATYFTPDLTVVGPEAPLVAGIVDQWPYGLPIWGPTAEMAKLEGDKAFAKKLMVANRVPTASYEIFGSPSHALSWLSSQSEKGYVVKATKLCGGKGVIVCDDKAETAIAIERMAEFKEAGKWFIIEDRLYGKEVSLMVLVAGGEILPLATSQDYKPRYDGNRGPNTGSMGSYSPVPWLTDDMVSDLISQTIEPIVLATNYRGTLYAGLMLTDEGPMVLEYNARLGDPETQAVLPRLKTDLSEVLQSGAMGRFSVPKLEWSNEVSVHVVLVDKDYPGDVQKGQGITGLGTAARTGAIITHAGTKLDEEETVAWGGRVIGVTGMGIRYEDARTASYNGVRKIHWPRMDYRKDIASGL